MQSVRPGDFFWNLNFIAHIEVIKLLMNFINTKYLISVLPFISKGLTHLGVDSDFSPFWKCGIFLPSSICLCFHCIFEVQIHLINSISGSNKSTTKAIFMILTTDFVTKYDFKSKLCSLCVWVLNMRATPERAVNQKMRKVGNKLENT